MDIQGIYKGLQSAEFRHQKTARSNPPGFACPACDLSRTTRQKSYESKINTTTGICDGPDKPNNRASVPSRANSEEPRYTLEENDSEVPAVELSDLILSSDRPTCPISHPHWLLPASSEDNPFLYGEPAGPSGFGEAPGDAHIAA